MVNLLHRAGGAPVHECVLVISKYIQLLNLRHAEANEAGDNADGSRTKEQKKTYTLIAHDKSQLYPHFSHKVLYACIKLVGFKKKFNNHQRWFVNPECEKYLMDDSTYVKGCDKTHNVPGEILGDGLGGALGHGFPIVTELDYVQEEVVKIIRKISEVHGPDVHGIMEDCKKSVSRMVVKTRKSLIENLIVSTKLREAMKKLQATRDEIKEFKASERMEEGERQNLKGREEKVKGMIRDREWLEDWVKRVKEEIATRECDAG